MYRLILFTLGALLLGVFAAAEPVGAASITVTTTDDELTTDGDCSLREAIQAANTDTAVDACAAGSGADTIDMPAGTYTLSIAGAGEDANASGDLDITADLTINGYGAATTIIDGASLDRLFHIVGAGATVEFSGLTIQNGLVVGTSSGGGIYNISGALTLSNSTVSGNAAGYGGGILSGGALALTNSTVSGNEAAFGGGGIWNNGTGTLTNSTVSGNVASSGFGGGGIWNPVGVVTLTNSTVSGNEAVSGGGITNGNPVVLGGTLTLINSTVSGNEATSFGGGGIQNYGTTSVKNTVVANNANDECSGAITSAGHNLSSDKTCGFTAAGDLQNTNPMLGPLADNGGPTKTHAFLVGTSPAIDAGSNDCPPPATDQRGVARPQGPACDIGAFEKGPKQVAPGDTDADGCTDEEENGTNPALGGQRNYLSLWDFFDTDTENGLSAGTHLVGAVSVGDIVNEVMHFGQSGNAGIDPLSDASNMTTYHTRFDRTVLGPNQWNLGPPDGAVSVGDIVAMVNQYGHSCLAPP